MTLSLIDDITLYYDFLFSHAQLYGIDWNGPALVMDNDEVEQQWLLLILVLYITLDAKIT